MAVAGILGKLKVILAADATQMQKGFKEAEGSTRKFSGDMRRVSDLVNRTFTRSLMAGTAALTAFGATSAKVGTEFQAAMQFVGATANATGDEMVSLEAEARNIGSTTLFSARQAAQGMTEFARAGMTTNEIISASRPAMLLAGATMTDMATATQGMSATLRQFGLDVSEASRVSDVLALATRKSLFNLTGLLTAMKYGGPQARAYGMSLEQAVAAMMEFRNIGLEAHQAGVYFRMMLAKTGKVTPEAEATLRQYGLATEDISLKTNSFADILKNLAEADIPKAAGAMEKIFGVRAGPVVQVLVENMKAGKDEFDAYSEALLGAGGTTEDMYNRLLDTVSAQFTIMKSAFEELMIVIFDTYGDALQEFFTELAEMFAFTASVLSTSTSLGNNLSSTLKNMTAWLRENRVTFATFIEDMINLLGALTYVLVAILKWSRILLSVFAGLFIASKVHMFSMAIFGVYESVKALTVGVYGLRTGIIALRVAMAAATGGVLPIILAITSGIIALAGAFFALGGSIGWSTDRTEEFLAAQEELARKQEEGYSNRSESSKDYVANLREELAASGDLDATTLSHLKHLEQMTAAQMVTNVEGGKWIEVIQDNKKVMVSQAVVFDLHNKQSAKGIELHGLLIDKLKQEADKLAILKNETKNMTDEAARNQNTINKSMGAPAVYHDLRSKFLKRYGVALEDSAAKEFANNQKILKSSKRVANQNRVRHDEERRLQHQRTQTAIQQGKVKAKLKASQGKSFIELQKKRIKALASYHKYSNNLNNELKNAQEDGLNTLRNNLGQELAAQMDKEDSLLELFREGSEQYTSIVAQGSLDRDKIRAKALAISINGFQKYITDLRNITLDGMAQTDDEVNDRKKETDLAALKKMFEINKRQFRSNSTDMMELQIQYLQAKEALDLSYEDKKAIKYKSKVIALQDSLFAEERANKISFLTELERLDFEYAERGANLGNGKKEKDARAFLEKLKNIKKRALGIELIDSLKNEKNIGEKATKLNLLSGKKGMGIFKKFLKSRADMKEREHKLDQKRKEYENLKHTLSVEERRKAEQELANEFNDIQKDKLKKTLKVFKDIAKAISSIIKGMTAIGKKGIESFKFFSNFDFDMRGIVEEFAAASDEMASKGGKMDIKAESSKKVSELVGQATGFMRMAVEAVPALLQELTKQLPVLFQTFVSAVPQIIQGFADNIGGLVQVVVDNIPAMLTAVLSALPNLITVITGAISTIIKALPAILDAIIAQLPMILEALIAGIIGIIYTLADILPVLIDKIVSLIPILLNAIFAAIPVLIPALIRLVLNVITSILEAIPTIIGNILDALPLLIEGLVGAIPVILQEIMAMLPRLIMAIVNLIPLLIIGVIKAIPQIIFALLKSLFTELLPAIPKIVIMVVKSALLAIVAGMKKLGQAFGDLFRSKEGKKEADKRRADALAASEGKIKDEFSSATGLEDFYSGINYIPSNMRVNVHQGEAIIPADRNAMGSRGGAQQAYAGGNGGNGSMNQSGPIEIAVMAEGRLLDAVQITAMKRGNAPGITKQLTRASGVTVGLDRGRFNYWTKKS